MCGVVTDLYVDLKCLFSCSVSSGQIAWALNKGIKPEYKSCWDVELGVTYIPWNKVKTEDLESFREGGMLDSDTLCPGIPLSCFYLYI